MRLFDRLDAWLRPSLPPIASSEALAARAGGLVATSQLGKPTWPKRDVTTYERDGYEKLALGFSLVGLIADTCSAIPLRVYEARADGTTPSLPTHPLVALMRRPNPEMWQGEFVWQVIATALVAGFCVVEKVRSAAGRVVELWPLDSSRLRAVPRNQAAPDWVLRIGSTEVDLRAEDVLVYRWRNRIARSPFGISPFEVLFRQIGLENAMTDFLKAFFDNGALSQQLIVVDTLPGQTLAQEQKDLLEEQFMRRHAGVRNAWRPVFTGGIKDVKDIGFDFQQLAWQSLRDLDELAVCQAFGVSPRKAKTRVGLEHTTQNATARVEDAEFYRESIIPALSRIDGVLTLGLLEEFEPPGSRVSLEFDYSDVEALQEDRNARATSLNPVFLGGGIPASVYFTEIGLPAPNHDYFMSPFTTERVPVARALEPAPPPAATPPPQLGGVRVLALGAGGPSERLAQRKAIGAANRRLIRAIADAREPSLRTFFRDQGARLVAAVKAPIGVAALAGQNGHAPETLALADFDWQQEETALRAVLTRLYQLAGETAFAAAADSLGVGISFDLGNPHVRSVMDRLGTRIVGINDETRRAVAETITAGEAAGKGIDAIAEDLTNLFAGFSESRAQTIARTESQVSLNLAGGVAWRQSGLVDRAQLFDNPDHTDDYGADDGLSCAQRNGLIVPLDDLELHVFSEHPNGSLVAAPVLIGDE